MLCRQISSARSSPAVRPTGLQRPQRRQQSRDVTTRRLRITVKLPAAAAATIVARRRWRHGGARRECRCGCSDVTSVSGSKHLLSPRVSSVSDLHVYAIRSLVYPFANDGRLCHTSMRRNHVDSRSNVSSMFVVTWAAARTCRLMLVVTWAAARTCRCRSRLRTRCRAASRRVTRPAPSTRRSRCTASSRTASTPPSSPSRRKRPTSRNVSRFAVWLPLLL